MIKKLILALILLTVNLLSAQTDSLVGDENTDLVAINALLREAGKHLGTHYRGGGKTPAGFDCSGLIGYVYRDAAGINLPRSTRELIAMPVPSVRREALQTGDLVFFATAGGGRVSHAGIYVGEGRFVHAPSSGGTVRLESLSTAYWQRSYLNAKRVIAGGQLANNF